MVVEDLSLLQNSTVVALLLFIVVAGILWATTTVPVADVIDLKIVVVGTADVSMPTTTVKNNSGGPATAANRH